MKRISELREKSTEQLKNRLIDINISLMRIDRQTLRGFPRGSKGQGSNTMYVSKLHSDKARILTLLTERNKVSVESLKR